MNLTSVTPAECCKRDELQAACLGWQRGWALVAFGSFQLRKPPPGAPLQPRCGCGPCSHRVERD